MRKALYSFRYLFQKVLYCFVSTAFRYFSYHHIASRYTSESLDPDMEKCQCLKHTAIQCRCQSKPFCVYIWLSKLALFLVKNISINVVKLSQQRPPGDTEKTFYTSG